MMSSSPERSDYRDFGINIKIFPDLIPFIGLVTALERERRRIQTTPKDFYLGSFKGDVLSYLSLGTSNWPPAEDARATVRGTLIAVRNASFAAYHTILPILGYLHLRQ